MTVLIINTVTLNGGDSAIAEAELAVIRRVFGDRTEVVLVDDHAAEARRHYPGRQMRSSIFWSLHYMESDTANQRFRRWLRYRRFWAGVWFAVRGRKALASMLLGESEMRFVRLFLDCDLVVATGGTYLVENYDLGQRFFDMAMAPRCGLPLVWFPQSMGPFRQPGNRASVRRLARRSELICCRDQLSRQSLADLGVTAATVRVCPDVAFVLADRSRVRRARLPSFGPDHSRPDRPRVAVSVRAWRYFTDMDAKTGMERYRRAIAGLVTHLVSRRGVRVEFVSSCQGVSGYKDDSVVAGEIFEELPEPVRGHCHVNTRFHSPRQLTDRLGGFDYVVSTRMRVAILALGVGVPVFPIAYEFKTNELFERLGFPHEIEQIESLSGADLVLAFDRFVDDLPAHRERIFDEVLSLRREALGLCETLRELFPERVARANAALSDRAIAEDGPRVLSGGGV